MLPRRPGATCPSGAHLVLHPQASVPRPAKSPFRHRGCRIPSLLPLTQPGEMALLGTFSNRNRNTRSSWSSDGTEKAPRHTRHTHRLQAHRSIVSSTRPHGGQLRSPVPSQPLPRPRRGAVALRVAMVSVPPPAINRGLLPLDDTAERSPPRRPLHTLRLHGSYSENLASFQKSDHWLEGHELWTFQFTFTRLCLSLCLHVARFPAGPRRAECRQADSQGTREEPGRPPPTRRQASCWGWPCSGGSRASQVGQQRRSHAWPCARPSGDVQPQGCRRVPLLPGPLPGIHRQHEDAFPVTRGSFHLS